MRLLRAVLPLKRSGRFALQWVKQPSALSALAKHAKPIVGVPSFAGELLNNAQHSQHTNQPKHVFSAAIFSAYASSPLPFNYAAKTAPKYT